MIEFILKNYTSPISILLCAIILDFILGDPYSFPHPVKLIGRLINTEEKFSRLISNSEHNLKICGFFIVLINVFLSFCIPFFLLKFLEKYRFMYFCVSVLLCYTCLAARCLDKEAKKVLHALSISLEDGRKQVANIVGRDTRNLSKEGVIRACVETVAENASDGVIAPLLYMIIFGAAGGLAYKTVNTMDSMLGYKNEKYRNLGFFPAKLDDIANFFPARICALLMLFGSVFCNLLNKIALISHIKIERPFKLKNGFKIWRRDCRKHSSPNSAHPESVVAGLLGVKLGGPNYYGGILIEKPYIGDEIKKIDCNDIKRTIQLMYSAEILALIFYIPVLLI